MFFKLGLVCGYLFYKFFWLNEEGVRVKIGDEKLGMFKYRVSSLELGLERFWG